MLTNLTEQPEMGGEKIDCLLFQYLCDWVVEKQRTFTMITLSPGTNKQMYDFDYDLVIEGDENLRDALLRHALVNGKRDFVRELREALRK